MKSATAERRSSKVVLSPAEATAVLTKETLDVDEAAWYLSVSRRWLVREGIRKFKIPYLRPPGSNRYLFRRHHLDAVLESWMANDRIGTPPKEMQTKAARKSKR